MYMTVGDLRRALEPLDDETPVYYQRIEDVYFNDHNWKGRTFVWEGPTKHMPAQLSQGVRAFSCNLFKPDDGSDELMFVIHAHY